MKKEKTNTGLTNESSRATFVLIIFLVVSLFTTYFLYTNTQQLFRWSLDQRLLGLASLSAMQFSTSELEKINGSESVGTDTYINVVHKLQKVRSSVKNIKYAYIFRKTSNENILEFVADADSLDPNKRFDLNGDGVIDESDALNFPGDEYDISEFIEFKQTAFVKPFVDPELSVDQWGTFLSGHSPISGSNKYVIGLDLEVSDFATLTQLAIFPFTLFVVFEFLILLTLTVIIRRMWKENIGRWAEFDRQKDELLGLVSHQLAAPITSIKWYIELFLAGDVGKMNDEQIAYLNSMQSIGEDLADLVSMILDVSRIQLDKMKAVKQDLDLNEFVDEILSVILPKAKEKEILLEIIKPEKLPLAKMDKRLTRMTMENLLTNAIKYTPKKGKVTVTIAIENNDMEYHVADNGCGIPKNEQHKIFGKLYRASNVRNTIEGNGFGLYVAKGATIAQGGQITFESKEGKGTTFHVTLPLR